MIGPDQITEWKSIQAQESGWPEIDPSSAIFQQ